MLISQELPVLNALARNFAVCDSWHASIPGPTWPNRLFACAASSDGLDHSPTTAEILTWETIDGVAFSNGSIFDALKRKSANGWRIYSGDDFPLVAASGHHAGRYTQLRRIRCRCSEPELSLALHLDRAELR